MLQLGVAGLSRQPGFCVNTPPNSSVLSLKEETYKTQGAKELHSIQELRKTHKVQKAPETYKIHRALPMVLSAEAIAKLQ